MRLDLDADFESYHIEGYAHAAQAKGEEGYFKAPLISQIESNLWMGGCIHGVKLPSEINKVISLYQWERYELDPEQVRVEVEMYDAGSIPDIWQLCGLATQVNLWRSDKQNVLVHCQAGLNRSSLITALSLIQLGDKPEEAIGKIRSARSPVCLCNQAFENWLLTDAVDVLKEWEEKDG